MKILSLLISISLFSQEKVDYVIIQNPQNLLIYNKYQQVIEKNEQVRFRDYSPFKILERNMQFNDQINYGMKVEYEGEQYYIGKNEKGHLLNLKDAGKIDVIENAEEIDRQIELLSNQSLQTMHNLSEALQAGDLIKPVFRKLNRYYIQINSGKFAWIQLNASARKKNWDWYVPDPMLEQYKKLLSDLQSFAERYSAKLKNTIAKMTAEERSRMGNPQLLIESSTDSIILKFQTDQQLFTNSFHSIYEALRSEYNDRADLTQRDNQVIFKTKISQ